ncbi:MAG: hypothetical protein FJ271_17100 [Planctomycetes bacterium]|nr:hypothetical protein [Planctomycetota bacterium]
MSQVTLDRDLQKKLHGLDQQMTFLDEDGKALGLFLPIDVYKKILSSLPIPFAEEELERRKNEPGGTSLAEIWKRLGGN